MIKIHQFNYPVHAVNFDDCFNKNFDMVSYFMEILCYRKDEVFVVDYHK
jgi:hypothetical protein